MRNFSLKLCLLLTLFNDPIHIEKMPPMVSIGGVFICLKNKQICVKILKDARNEDGNTHA